MSERIKATVVGSYPVPSWLVGNASKTVLRDAVVVVLRTQELAGLNLVTDGELKRFDPSHPETNGMIDYFAMRMQGIRTCLSRSDLERFRTDSNVSYRSAPAGVVEDKVGEGTLNLPEDFNFIRPLTDAPLKFTCTGPHMLAKVLTNTHYPDSASLAMDIAAVLRRQLRSIKADVIQLDEANISGHPAEADWAAEAVNHVLDGIQTEKAVHICFGNYAGQTVQRGSWPRLLPFLNALRVDHLVLEFARRGYGEIEVLRDVESRIALGVGVIDIKDNQVEPPDVVARRIEKIVEALGPDRLQYVHPDCGMWMLHRSVADAKMRTLVKGRNLFEGAKP